MNAKTRAPRPSSRARRQQKLDAALAQLENAQLVRRTTDQDLSYLFKHALTQDAAYDSLLLKRRREIHLRVAKCIEQVYPDRLDEYAARLAQHYEEAGDDANMLAYASRAGDLAARVYANAEAIVEYTRALSAAERAGALTGQLVHLYTQRGRAYELSGQYAQAIANYEELGLLGRRRGERSLELQALVLRAIIRSTPTQVFDARQAQAQADQALALARELGDHAAEAKVLWILGLLNWFTGRTPEAAKYGEDSLALARRFDLREQLAFTLNNLIYPYFSMGRTDQALAVAAEARELWRELDNKPMLADTLGNIAQDEFELGEFDRALDYSDQAFQLSQSIGSLWGQSFSLFRTGHVYWERGEPDRAIQSMSECVRLAEKAGFIVPQFGIRADLGLVYANLGDIQKGLELVLAAPPKAEGFAEFQVWVYSRLARVYLLAGDLAAAELAGKQAHAPIRSDHIGNLDPTLSSSLAFADIELALAQHEHTRAAKVADELIRFLESARLRTFLPEARYLRAQAWLRQDEREAARSELEGARAVAEAIGSRRVLWQILSALSRVEIARGNHPGAAELRTQAREIVEFIADHTPPDLHSVFLKVPEVQKLTET